MRAQEHYAALVESSDDAIIAKDLDSIVVSWNPAAERLFGHRSDEILGRSIRELIPATRQREEDDILARIRTGERVGQFVTQRLHKDGHPIDVFITVSPVRDAEGLVVGASTIARDASEFLAAQRRIEESERSFRLLAEGISQMVWIAEPDGTVTWSNGRMQGYLGMGPGELATADRQRFHHPDHVERVLEGYRAALAAGEPWEDIFPLRGTDGDYRWFLGRAEPVRGDDGSIVQWFGTNTDITEQREQADHVRLLLHEVDHRAKNLLGTVQALARRTADGDAAFIEKFERRMASLAMNQDLLVKGRWREVSLEELVRGQLAFLGRNCDQIAVDGPDVALTATAAEAIGMALHELATNSLKYGALSSAGGAVEIRWEAAPGERSLVLSWRERGGPQVVPPARKGFGTKVICDMPRRALRAETAIDYFPEGVVWRLAAGDVLAFAPLLAAAE